MSEIGRWNNRNHAMVDSRRAQWLARRTASHWQRSARRAAIAEDAVKRIATRIVAANGLDKRGVTLDVRPTEWPLPQEIRDYAENQRADGEADAVHYR